MTTRPCATPRDRRPGRRLARGVMVSLVAVPALVLLGCSSDGSDESPETSIATSSSTVPPSTPSSNGQEAPSGGSGTGGATPGQDGNELDAPGGTTPVPDPGGDGAGNNGNQTN